MDNEKQRQIGQFEHEVRNALLGIEFCRKQALKGLKVVAKALIGMRGHIARIEKAINQFMGSGNAGINGKD